MANRCFGPEHIQLHLRDHYFWPGMLTDCRQAQLECPKCKSFGAATRNSLLQPIRRTQPFALVAGDYLSLPAGKGGFKTVGLYIDTYSGFVWGTKLKTTGSSKSTVASLKRIFHDYATPKTFMSDGGSHFDNNEVDQFCDKEQVRHIVTPAYAPWVNGLIENANKLLLGRLKRLCAPNHDVGDETTTATNSRPLPESWPEHLDEAIRQMNDRILPALNATPRELLFGLPFRPDSTIPLVPLPTLPFDTHTNFTLAETFRANAHLLSLEDAERRKTSFDSNSPVTEFYIGNLVQVYDSASDFNYRSINKLAPKWSEPRIIHGKFSNSFSLCTTAGIPLKGLFHSRRLRRYIPLRGTPLDIAHPREIITPSHLPTTTSKLQKQKKGWRLSCVQTSPRTPSKTCGVFRLHQGTPGWSSDTPMR
jgi:transposase InsO family protein